MQSQAPADGAADPYAACTPPDPLSPSTISILGYPPSRLSFVCVLTTLRKTDGGYQAYLAMWYQAMAAQQQTQGQPDPSKPPGTA